MQIAISTVDREPAPQAPLLYCEDDIEFTSRWLDKLNAAHRVAARHLRKINEPVDRYVLSLYAAYPFKPSPISDYPTQKYYGNQAVLLPPMTLRLLTEAMRSHARDAQGATAYRASGHLAQGVVHAHADAGPLRGPQPRAARRNRVDRAEPRAQKPHLPAVMLSSPRERRRQADLEA